MGNNIGGNSKASAKVMKINGEFFKLKTPTKVIDIIKDYPDHILLDSQDFLRFNLRAKPLDLDFQLQPKKIYLLFQPPKFPQTVNNDNNNVAKRPLRRVKSGLLESTTTTLKELRMLMTKRSVSDLSIATKSKAVIGSSHSEDGDGGGGGDENPVVGPTRVILKLPKAQVKRIMEESNDDAEVAQRIIQLSAAVDGGSAVVDVATASRENGNVVAAAKATEGDEQVTEIEVVDRHCFSVHSMCGSNHGRKYKKLSF